MTLRFPKTAVIVPLLLVLLMTTGFQSAHAVDKSRVFVCLLFLSGLGSTAAGAVMQGQANETYDQYMHTAVQTEMDKLIDDYDRKHQQSIIASRTGLGLVAGAILLSLVDAAHIPPPEGQEEPAFFGSEYRSPGDATYSARTQKGEILFAINGRF